MRGWQSRSPDERSYIRGGVSLVPDVAALIRATKPQTRLRLPAAHRARVLQGITLENGGCRECRVRAAPAVSCARCTKENAHEHTGSAEAVRHSLRNGFTAYAVLSPATNSSCHRRCRLDGGFRSGWIDRATDSLAPATGVGTTRFCRTHERRSSCAPRAAHEFDLALRPPCAPTLSRPSHPASRS